MSLRSFDPELVADAFTDEPELLLDDDWNELDDELDSVADLGLGRGGAWADEPDIDG